MVSIKRIYDRPTKLDGFRVLVDRLWPRGVSREKAALDAWLKDVAPSSELRTWFGHEPERFPEFTARYEAELENNPAVAELKNMLNDHRQVTLLYAASDPDVNHAKVLLAFLQKH
jgi:DNA-3-methyladenine glycosylase